MLTPVIFLPRDATEQTPFVIPGICTVNHCPTYPNAVGLFVSGVWKIIVRFNANGWQNPLSGVSRCTDPDTKCVSKKPVGDNEVGLADGEDEG